MQPSLDSIFDASIALDVVPDPFLFDLNWSAQELTDAACRWLPPLRRFGFAPSANDAALHRSRRRTRFLAVPPLPPRFRVGG